MFVLVAAFLLTASFGNANAVTCNEELVGNGAGYRGCQTVTRGGIECQAWNSQEPHSHSRTPENYPDSGLVGNYCRNPDGTGSIWCYTTDDGTRWDYCDPIEAEVPIVYPGGWGGEKCVFPFTYKGVVYTECTTVGGYKSPWCSHDADYDGNWGYCTEDPDSDPYPGMGHEDCVFPFEYKGVTYNSCTRTNNHATPWCSHNSVHVSGQWSYCIDAASYGDWESEGCSVTCGTGVENFNRECSGYGECTGAATKTEACNLDACETCQAGNEELVGDGAGYRGCQSVTRGGIECQAWNSQEPHSHSRTPENYPDSGLVGNYCRNPDGVSSIWCYTTDDGTRWDYCDPIKPEVLPVEPEVLPVEPEVLPVEPEVLPVEPEVPVVVSPKEPEKKPVKHQPKQLKWAQAVAHCKSKGGLVNFQTEAEYNKIIFYLFINALPQGRYWTGMEVKPYGENTITLSTGATGNFAKWTSKASLKMRRPKGFTKTHIVINAVTNKAATGMFNVYKNSRAWPLCAADVGI